MTDQFEGMTQTRCPAACSVNGCVISGKPYCAHPKKGGLHHADMQSQPAMDRLAAANGVLAHAALESVLAKRRA